MKRFLAAVVILLIIVLYILFFPVSIHKEIYLKPVWVQDVQSPRAAEAATTEGPMLSFTLGDHIYGYIDERGEFHYLNQSQYRVAISDRLFADYSRISDNVIFRKPNGHIHMNIESSGYPFFLRDRIYIVDKDRSGLSEWDDQGNRLWSIRYGTHITAVDNSEGHTLIGLLDGRLPLYDEKGNEVFRFTADRSKINTVYGAAISFPGNFITLIAGVDPQRVILIQKKENGYNSVFTEVLTSDFRRNVLMRFSKDNRKVFFEGEGMINCIDVVAKELTSFPFPAPIIAVHSELHKKPVWIVGNTEGGESILRVFLPNGRMALETVFQGPASFFEKKGNHIFLGTGYNLMRFDLEEG